MFSKLKEMEKKKKIIIGAVTICSVLVIGAGVFFLTRPKEEAVEETPKMIGQIDLTDTENARIEGTKKINTSEELKKERTSSGLRIVDIQLESNNALTNFTATVENTTTQEFKARDIVIYLKNKNGEKYASVDGYIDDIQPGGKTYVSAYTSEDIANAYDFEIQFK